MIIVTGGAGFIGSAVVWALNERGVDDILIVDPAGHKEQEHNLAAVTYEERIDGDAFRQHLAEGAYDDAGVTAVIHLGAISSTMEKDWDKLQDTNVDFSQEVIRWCVDKGVRCVYASSGATYGDGSRGYSDRHDVFETLEPLNLYGKSKLDVDIWARDAGHLDTVAGLRYFNVFGPNEWHKEDMRSVIAKKYPDLAAGKPMTLFKSYNADYKDGDQMRDFVYVKDAVAATLYMMDNPDIAGVFNVGGGVARTWNDVARAMFAALDKEPVIEYVDMPDQLRTQYQYYTQADVTKLQAAGYTQPFISLEDAIKDYVQNHLVPHRHLGENTA